MDLADDGAEWLKVRCSGAAPSWRVDSRLGGTHYKLPDAFPTMHAAQGAALLLEAPQPLAPVTATREPASISSSRPSMTRSSSAELE